MLEDRIREALAARKDTLGECPVRKTTFHPGKCPKCGATESGPCWINVEADAAFVDAIKELIA